jgi:hypothetical protein
MDSFYKGILIIILLLMCTANYMAYQAYTTVREVNTKVDSVYATFTTIKDEFISVVSIEADELQNKASEKINENLDSLTQSGYDKLKKYLNNEE